jgi:hypothetical protein
MQGMRMIPTRVHGMADYLVGILLLVSPWLFGFAKESSTAKWTFIIAGAIVLLTSLMTNYELSLAKMVPMHVHLGLDAVLGIVLAVSPWLFGYANDTGTNGWLPAVAIGLGDLLIVMMSSPWPAPAELREREERSFGGRRAGVA